MELDEQILDETNSIQLTDAEIFTRLWTSPRLVFKYIDDNSYDKYVKVLLVFGGITSAFNRAATRSMGDEMSLLAVIGLSVVAGGLLGWITYYIYAALVSWTGKWLGGRADTKSLLRMTSYAMFPSIVALLLLIPQVALFGNGVFQSDLDIYAGGSTSAIVFMAISAVELVLGIWTIVIFVIGISEVQQLSIGKSILNMFLPVLLIVVPIVLIILAFGSF